MEISLFGKKIILEVKNSDNRKNKENKEKNNLFTFRFLLAMFVFLIFGIMIEMSNLKEDYAIGKVAENDVIAYKNVTYHIDLLDNNLKNRIKKNTTPEYDKNKKIEVEVEEEIKKFFQEMKLIDINDNNKIEEYIKNKNLNLTVEEYKDIAVKYSLEYVVRIFNTVDEIYEVGIIKKEEFSDIVNKNDISINELDKKMLSNFIKPNLTLNEEKTLEKIEKNMMSLKDKEVKIYKGDIIVKKGEVIDSDAYEKMEKLNLISRGNKIIKSVGMLLTFVIMASLFYYVLKKYSEKIVTSKSFYPSIITIIIINLIYTFFLKKSEFLIYLLPVAMIPIMLTILGNKIFALTFTFINMIILSRDDSWFLVTVAVAIVAIYKADKLTSRSDIVKLGIFTGMFQGLISLSYGLVNQLEFSFLLAMIVLSVMSGILTGMISLALLPYFENAFEILTDIKLLELSDFSHTLLKQLLVTAPGTFHHSIMVGALAESGAEAIGANATFARVASYYHDIGKMKRPEFFIENQKGGENTHNKLKPSLSALIITSHTKDGYIMGKQAKLPKEILDVILEHHGTTLVQFFYYKALENGEEVLESDFRYSGPKPKTKEGGIILLADTIEAAVRSSEDKSKEGIENLIRYLIKYKIDDNQLSESELTLGEIEVVIQAFLNTLQGAYHERIKYPKIGEERPNRNNKK